MKVMRIPYIWSTVLLCVLNASAQMPGMNRWWERPIVRDLGLSRQQREEILAVVRDSRTHLIKLRAAVEIAEAELRDEMNEEVVDADKAGAAIDKVVGARAELMRNISQMSLRLRMILTAEQWRELQKRVRQPARNPAIRAPGAGGTGKSPVPAPDGFLGL
jgi:Spy/CpxP family protein refolding chaperone